ncbi:MAG: hypothetical protein VR73_03740 [Gammaproteobacteria bacterium BRH_c0]|nr:MAG: hypothetical protein VR73_03740 [Gammaproteobacteria bacterium BRH_c0]
MTNLEKIVSGGQTGVDRAALDAAMARNFPVGGWCPEGRLAEDGIIPDRYPLQELSGAGYRQRTRQNVRDSDATLIIYYDTLSGGTEQTLALCLKEHKPYLLIDAEAIDTRKTVEKLLRFLGQGSIKVLNVAGPRGSAGDWAYSYTHTVIDKLLDRVING